ncbi:MAG: NYN domain-containing protein [Campylobacter sp.]|uniref:NYN domain-containing protein n=1 Tax=Campylobacter sp. TaxID=205 RepID=UPI002AA960B7|nr:NYN domain-containing protein [Campylobacter sp.]MCI6580165.1 NYN domain-containing protein [Campylobacter sp.]
MDCLQMAYERTDITHFALVASDSDFRNLVFKLLDLGHEVLGFGESKSDNYFAGILLLLLKAPELKIQAKKYKTK